MLNSAIAQHLRSRCRELLERSERSLGAEFLHKSQYPVQDNDGDNRYRVEIFTEQAGYQCRPHQHQHHKILELVQQQGQRGYRLPFGQLIVALLLQPLRGILSA
ncbi:hypothetical protein D3C73_1233440 [compost metagenome]